MKFNAKGFWPFIFVLGALLLLGSLANMQPCAAATVWSDNFNDGDLAGWTTLDGTFSAANNYLEATEDDSRVYRSSTTATGTWSFDILVSQDWDQMIGIICIGHHADVWHLQNGYSLTLFTGIRLELFEDGAYTGLGSTALEPTPPYHIDITRNSTGYFNVFIDGALGFGAQDNTHTSSQYFEYHALNGRAIDNIVVSNTVDITPGDTGTDDGTTDTPTVPGFPIASIALGAIAAIGTLILIRRRRR